MKNAYGEIEKAASERLLGLLPEDLKKDYTELFYNDNKELQKIVKAADKISALIKCRDELSLGNRDFAVAEQLTLKAIEALELPCANVFIDEFLESFSLSLDEQK